MDLNKVKSGNDFLMQMYQEDQVTNASPDTVNVDNAGADAADVDNDTELEVINDASSDTVVDSNANDTTVNDNSTDLLDDWDDSAPATIDAPKFDFKQLGKALELDGVDNQEALVSKVKEIVQKSRELEQKAATLSSIPEPLQEAIEVANKGGDYLEYLGISTIDYDALDDRTLVEEQLLSYGLFKNADGSINEEALAEHVEGLSDKDVLVQAAQARARFKHEQAVQRQAVTQKAEQRKAENVKQLRDALDKLEAVGPFKLKPNHKKDMYDTFVNGQMMKELFQTDGKFDFNKALRIYFKEKYSDKIDKLVTEAVRNQTIKSVKNDIKNVDLQSLSRIARPDGQTAVDPMDLYMRKLQGLK